MNNNHLCFAWNNKFTNNRSRGFWTKQASKWSHQTLQCSRWQCCSRWLKDGNDDEEESADMKGILCWRSWMQSPRHLTISFLSFVSHCWFIIPETKSLEMPLITACTLSLSFGLLQSESCNLEPEYSLAATCVFFEVARTFSKPICVNALGTWKNNAANSKTSDRGRRETLTFPKPG